MIILDTNVLSELMRPTPADPVSRWIATQPIDRLFVTAITQAEILFGIALLPIGRRQKAMQVATDELFAQDFAGRILPFDETAAAQFGRIAAGRRSLGRPIGALDAQIAAIATARDFAVATRNVTDFDDCGLTIINPWRD